jgi:hypothetical protein
VESLYRWERAAAHIAGESVTNSAVSEQLSELEEDPEKPQTEQVGQSRLAAILELLWPEKIDKL